MIKLGLPYDDINLQQGVEVWTDLLLLHEETTGVVHELYVYLPQIQEKLNEKLIRALEWFRTLDPNISVNSVSVFLYAINKELYPTQRDIEKKLGASNAAASRNVS